MSSDAARPSSDSHGVRVLVSLECTWCGRSVDDVPATRDPVSGRLLLAGQSEGLNLAGGRPRCGACGGTMFLEDWRLKYDGPDPTEVDFDDDDDRGGRAA